MNLGATGIKKLEIGGEKVISLKSLSGIEIEGYIHNINVFQQWIEKIFEGKDIIRKEIIKKQTLTKRELFNQIWNYEGRSVQQSYDHFISLGKTGILELDIGGKKIKSLKSLSGIQIEGDVHNPSIFQQWIEKVFEGKDIIRKEIIKKQTLTKRGLFNQIWNYEGRSVQQSYDHFISLGKTGIHELEIGGNKVISLKNISGFEIKGNIYAISTFRQWIDKVFEGKDIEKKNY